MVGDAVTHGDDTRSLPPSPVASSLAVRHVMQGNRRVDTQPEVHLRQALHRRGLRFRKDFSLNLGELRVRPDIVFTRSRIAIFVDGCFWHCCPDHGNDPITNSWYWGPKLQRNIARDRRVDAALKAAGWVVVRLWSHENIEGAAEKVTAVIAQANPQHGGLASSSPRPATGTRMASI